MKTDFQRDELKSRTRRAIAAAAVVIQLCLGTVYAWSIFKMPVMIACGWSEVQTQSVYMIYGMVFAFAVALGGGISDRIGPRPVGLIGALLFSLGLFMSGLAVQHRLLALLQISYGGISAIGAGCAYVCPLACLIRWFPDKRGLVTGLAIAGYGFGAMLLGGWGPGFIIKFGVTATFYVWGAVAFVILSLAAVILINPPEDWAPPVGTSRNTAINISSLPLNAAIRTPRFWILWVILFAGTTAGIGLISQLSPLIQDKMILSLRGPVTKEELKRLAIAAGGVVGLAGIFNGCGRLAWSWCSDYIDRKTVCVLIFICLAAGFASMPCVAIPVVVAILCWFLLSCYGGIMATMPALSADEFGPGYIGRIYGIIFTAAGPGALFGAYLFVALKEKTGGFAGALYAESGVALIGLIMILILKRRSRDAVKDLQQ